MWIVLRKTFLQALSERTLFYFAVAVVLVVSSWVCKIYLKWKRHKLKGRPEVLKRLQEMHKNGANYEEMASFLISKGVPRTIADQLIAKLELGGNDF